jgi:membrane protein YdbS with pleckstrin-like domain
VAVLGTLLNSNYISNINTYSWPAQIPSQAMAAIRAGVQGAHVVAQKFSGTPLAQTIIHQADTAFVNSAKDTMIVSAIIMVVASLVTLVILPNRIRHHKPDNESESD